MERESENETLQFDKMAEYVQMLFNVFWVVNNKSDEKGDRRAKYISLIIYNYMVKMAKDNQIDLRELTVEPKVDLTVMFEYMQTRNILLYDFSKIDMSSVDITKREDIERFVLTHIYYITQQMSPTQ